MPSSYTPNYQLNQWEADDRVQRTDFNADNAKIEAALSGFSARLAFLERAVPNLARYVGLFGVLDLLERKKGLSQWAMIREAFLYPSTLTLTGGAAITNGVLTLSGKGATGTMTAGNLSIDAPDWTQARMYLHRSLGCSVTPRFNGEEMTFVSAATAPSPSGGYGAEDEYVWNGPRSSSVQISLDLACGNGGTLSVYDYSIVFF